VLVAVLADAGAVYIGGASAASHRAAQSAVLPTWSPDGKQIAFAYTSNQFSPKREVPEENAMDVLDAPLAFSPDSTQLVFSRSSWDGWNSGPPALMAINVAGGGSVPLAQSGITGASVVPNDARRSQTRGSRSRAASSRP
jgi:hypothetical protein